MKRHDLLTHLKRQGCELLQEGSRHSIFWRPTTGSTSAVPRHTEIADRLVAKICKDLGIPLP